MSFLSDLVKYRAAAISAGAYAGVSGGASNVVVMPGTQTVSYAVKVTPSNIITVPAVAAGDYDFIGDILPGMTFTAAGGIAHAGVVVSVSGREVTMSESDSHVSGYGMFGRDWAFTVPAGVEVIYASYCGGGQGGGGGHSSAGGGGGGGGASVSFVDYPLYVTPGEVITIVNGAGALGGATGAAGAGTGNGGVSVIFAVPTVIAGNGESAYAIRSDTTLFATTSLGQIIPPAGPANSTANRAQPGTSTNGGKGGDGGLLMPGVVSVAGGATGTGVATVGAPALFKGSYGTTGGSGSSGVGSTSGASAEGGSDGLHTDHTAATAAGLGGSGGSSQFGKGGNIGNGALGGYGRGYGAGGGGGAATFIGGRGAPGITIFRY